MVGFADGLGTYRDSVSENEEIEALVYNNPTYRHDNSPLASKVISCDFSKLEGINGLNHQKSKELFYAKQKIYSSDIDKNNLSVDPMDLHLARIVALHARELMNYDVQSHTLDAYNELLDSEGRVKFLSDFVGKSSSTPLSIAGKKILDSILPLGYFSALLGTFAKDSNKNCRPWWHSTIIFGNLLNSQKTYSLELSCAPELEHKSVFAYPSILELEVAFTKENLDKLPYHFYKGTNVFTQKESYYKFGTKR